MKVNGKDDNPSMKWKIIPMFETTNQCLLVNSCYIIIFLGEIHQKISPNVLARKGRPVGLLGLGDLSNGACLSGFQKSAGMLFSVYRGKNYRL
jgi:hypothetical protein